MIQCRPSSRWVAWMPLRCRPTWAAPKGSSRFSPLSVSISGSSIFWSTVLPFFQKRTLLEVTLEEWQQTLAGQPHRPFPLHASSRSPDATKFTAGGAQSSTSVTKGSTGPGRHMLIMGLAKQPCGRSPRSVPPAWGRIFAVNAVIPGPVMKPAGARYERQKLGRNRPGVAPPAHWHRRRRGPRRRLPRARRVHHRHSDSCRRRQSSELNPLTAFVTLLFG